jgi:hypothetical protein
MKTRGERLACVAASWQTRISENLPLFHSEGGLASRKSQDRSQSARRCMSNRTQSRYTFRGAQLQPGGQSMPCVSASRRFHSQNVAFVQRTGLDIEMGSWFCSRWRDPLVVLQAKTVHQIWHGACHSRKSRWQEVCISRQHAKVVASSNNAAYSRMAFPILASRFTYISSTFFVLLI